MLRQVPNIELPSHTSQCSSSNVLAAVSPSFKPQNRTLNSPKGRRIWCRAEYRPRIEPRRDLPAAPPARSPPPPPPPPPPPLDLNVNISRRALAAIMIGGTVAWYGALRAGMPLAGIDRGRNLALLRTKGGNVVAATQDESGRLFLFDRMGNIYYDTEDPALGMYIVDTEGEVYNKFIDTSGTIQQVYVGNLSDITSIKVTQIGGVPIEQLQRSIRGFRGGQVVGFPKLPEGNQLTWENLMPPNAPAGITPGDDRLTPPPMLEELEIELEPKGGGGLFGLGGSRTPAEIGNIDLFKTLRREK